MAENKFLISKKEKQYLALILLLSFIIKVILAFVINVELRSDSMVYDALAKSIVEKGEYSFEGKPTALLISGYPIFLAGIYKVFGYEQTAVKLVQALLETGTVFFFFLICLLIFREKQNAPGGKSKLQTKHIEPGVKYALTGTALFAFFPSNILYSQTVLTEPLFGFLAMALFYLCVKDNFPDNIFWIGIIWGLAIMVRSSFALSVLLIPLYLFIYRQKLLEGYKNKRLRKAIQYSIIFGAGIFLMLAPWLIRNKVTMGTFTLATQGGFTFWSGSNPDATGTWYHKIEDTNPLFNEQDEAKRDREFYKLGFDYALHNPHKFLITGVKKLGYLFSSERMALLYFTEGDGKEKTSTEVYRSINPFYTGLVNLPYMAVMLMGTWGLLMLRRYRFIIYGFVISWMATIFLFVALSRYHYVLIPFFIIGTVQLMYLGKRGFRNMTLTEKIIAAGFSLFLLGVWASEFYLLLTK